MMMTGRWPVHVRLGDALLVLDKPGPRGRSPQEVGGVIHLIVVTVGDVDAHHAGAAAGAAILVPRADRPRARDYERRDGEGDVFSFIS